MLSPYVVIEIGGRQLRVSESERVFVNRLSAKVGETLSLNEVFLHYDGKQTMVGTPIVRGLAVKAKVLDHLKDKKVIVFKKKRRKGYRVKNGHRQPLTEILIEKIGSENSNTENEKLEEQQ